MRNLLILLTLTTSFSIGADNANELAHKAEIASLKATVKKQEGEILKADLDKALTQIQLQQAYLTSASGSGLPELVSVYYNGSDKVADIRVNGSVVKLKEKSTINQEYVLNKINETGVEIKNRRNGKIRFITFTGASARN
jgi:DNA-binding protein YbaB